MAHRNLLTARRFRRSAIWVVAAAVGLFAGSANACSPSLRRSSVSANPTEQAEWQKQIEQDRKAAAQAQRKEFRDGLRTGKIDSAKALAELLIPNVREWIADRSDCSPEADGDGPQMSMQDMLVAAFAGSELHGLSGNTLSDIVTPSFRRGQLDAYNSRCNAELRARFADRLRLAVSRRERDDALLLLSNVGERRAGYFHFVDAKRVTRPVAATSSPAMAEMLADRRHPVTRALEGFWADALPQLGSPELTCPAAHAQFIADRDVELQRLRRKKSYSSYVERAARERGQR